MRVRTIELRILGASMAALWFATCVLVLADYHPGGPADLAVGLTLAGPVLIALAAVVWPPVAHGGRAFATTAWLGLGAILLLVPSLWGTLSQFSDRGQQALLPSLEAAYPWILALIGTGWFAGLGIARRRLGETALRRRRLVVGTAIGLGLVLAAGGTFTTAAVANALALRDRPAAASAFGPTDPLLEPPPCDGPLTAGPTARLNLTMDAAIDGRRTGQVTIDGFRNGTDFFWTGFAATRVTLGQEGLARVGGRTWILHPGAAWAPATLDRAVGRDLDVQLVAVALAPGNRTVAEDRGVVFIEGARARDCRITLDGTTLRRALPEIDLLVGSTDVSRWRGDLDYWIFADGQLGQADGQMNGPAVGLASDALLAQLRFRMTAIDRGTAIIVQAPAP